MKWETILKRKWLFALVPAVIGLLIIEFISRKRVIRFLISLEADFDVWVILIGIGLSMVLAMVLATLETREHIHRRSIEQARAEAFAEHHRFLRRLDHELKNPLMALRAGLVNLSATLDSSSPQERDILTTMEMQTLRLNRLVSDLRKLADLENIPLELQTVNVSELLRESVLLIQDRPELQQRHLKLDISNTPEPLPTIVGDVDLLLLAVHNLLDNALKYTEPGDRIRLSASADEYTLKIQVTDTGIGICEDELSLVWEELYRGKHPPEVTGSGIGLSLVQAIVQRHGGRVSLQSRPEYGAQVNLHLPLGNARNISVK